MQLSHFLFFYKKTEDPRGAGGNYLIPKSTTSLPVNPDEEVNFKEHIFLDESALLVQKSSLSKSGSVFTYFFQKANDSLPSFTNFKVSFPENWDVYEIIRDKTNPDGIPTPPKYMVALLNNSTGEVITISQFPDHIFGCNYSSEKLGMYCQSESLQKINTNLGNSYLYDNRKKLPYVSQEKSFQVCIDITENFDGAYNHNNNELGVDCTFGTKVGLIDIYIYHIGPASEISSEIIEILKSIAEI